MDNSLGKTFISASDISSGLYDGIKGGMNGYKDFVDMVLNSTAEKSWTKLKDPQLLWKIPKLALLLSDSCIMFGCGGPELKMKIQHKFAQPFSFVLPKDLLPRIQNKSIWPALTYFQPSVVTTWINDAKDLIADGKAVYVPERGLLVEGEAKGSKKSWDLMPMHQSLPLDALLPLGYYGRPENTAIIDSAHVQLSTDALASILDVSLPYIEDISLTDFYKLYKDEYNSVVLLRKALRSSLAKALKELNNTQTPDVIHKLCLNLKHDEIDPELAKLNLAYKRVVKTKSFSAIGAAVSTVTLSAAALLAPSIPAYVALFGTSGLVLTMKEFSEFQNNKVMLKENPYYFLWKMKMTQKS
ncbi:MAG TPA: hypothetical protein DCZ94_21065 [Lentisphaeria bacterium]|nr:MAG: hypothetical protein A2X48_23270 [Lentisphaerae bacterium GWF2_49_21]HBC89436.1 hypothetical protein [Lentisphaeria bacterium]